MNVNERALTICIVGLCFAILLVGIVDGIRYTKVRNSIDKNTEALNENNKLWTFVFDKIGEISTRLFGIETNTNVVPVVVSGSGFSTHDCKVTPADYGYKGVFAANVCGDWKYYANGNETTKETYLLSSE
jgi:hypothetical protein